MDTHHVEPPMSVADVVRRAVDQVVAGDDAVLSGGFEASLALDGVADELADRRIRVLRAATPASNKLSLTSLLAQVTGRPDLDGHDDEVLEHGSKALTVPGDACDGIALLVDGAEALQGSALLYLQMVGRTAPMLRFVFAGDGGLPDLHDDKVAGLRTRLAALPALTLAGASSAALLPQAGPPKAGQAPAARPPSVPPGPAFGSAPLVVPLVPSPPPPGSQLPGPLIPAPSGTGAARPDPSVLAPVPAPLLADWPAAAASVHPPALAVPPAEAPAQAGIRRAAGRRRTAVWAGAGAAMAACLALGVLIGRWNGPGVTASASSPEPDGAPVPVTSGATGAGVVPSRAGTPQPVAPQPVALQPTAARPGGSAPATAAAMPPAPQPGLTGGMPPAQAAGPAMPDSQTAPDAGRPVPDAPRRVSAPRSPGAATRPRTAAPHDTDARLKEAAAPGRDPAPAARHPRRAGQAGNAQDVRAADEGRGESYAPPWQPVPPGSRPDGPGPRIAGQPDSRPIIGTFTTDANGVRTFRQAP